MFLLAETPPSTRAGVHSPTNELWLARYLATAAELRLDLQKQYQLRAVREGITANIDALAEPMKA